MSTHIFVRPSSSLTGACFALLAAIFFSAKAIFVKLAYRHGVDAITLLMFRMAFALPFFVLVAAIEQRRPRTLPLTLNQGLGIVALGFVGYYMASMLDFAGLQYVTASIERLTLFLYPTLTVLFSFLFLGRKMRIQEMAALLISYAGIALAVLDESASGGSNTALGVSLVFGSTVAYAAFLVGSGELIPRIGSNRFMALGMIFSCLCVIVQFVVTRDVSALAQPWPVYGYGFLIATVSTVLPAFMLATAIRHIGASHTSIIGAVGPVATMMMATAFLGEAMSSSQILGAILVIGGVLLLGVRRH